MSSDGKPLSVYLDCNATTPIEPSVAEIVSHYLKEDFGNAASRTHDFGASAKRAVESARDAVAALVNASRDEVIFTSGATESNNIAILGLAAYGEKCGKRHLVSTGIEHKAVLEPIEHLGSRGFDVSLVAPTPGGWVDPEELRRAVRPDTLLVSVMHANNETGVLQPIDEIARALAGTDAYLHVDAAQTFGKEFPGLKNKRVDLVSISGHKIYGPKGIGALALRRRGFERLPLTPIMFGGGHERGLRPGTLAVELIAGLGKAAELALTEWEKRRKSCEAFRARALDAITPLRPEFNGDQDRCMPHVINVSFPGVDSEAAIVALKGVVAISNGSACTSHSYEPSHVLLAMGLSKERTQGALRLSWSHLTPDVDWGRVVETLSQIVN